ncbi:sperm-associated antigen 17-like, partial [Diretmus argenteus]
MAPKRVPGLIAAPFEQDSWSACVSVVVGRSPEDEELIRALELAVQQPLRKLFTLLTWDSTLAKIRELGNPKTKKRKDVPMFYEVTEPAKVLLDAEEEIPCDLMAQILKFQLLDIRSNDQHRRAAEQAGEENPKGKAGPGSATKDKRGAKAKKPPPPIGSSKERETKLKRRAENVEFIEAEVHGSVELAEQTRKLEMFWSDLGSVLDGGSPGSKLHDTARLSCTITDPQLPSPAQDSQAMLALGRRVFESVAGLIYDCLDWRRQHQHYRDNLKLINIPTVVGLEQPPEVVVSTEQSLPRLAEAAEEPRANIVPSLDHQLASYMLRSFLPLLRTQQERSHMLNSLLTLRLVEEFGVEEAQQNADPEHPLVFRHHNERALRLRQTTVCQGFDPVEVELSLMKLSPVWDLIHSAALQRNSDPRRLACKQQLLHYCTQDGVSWPEGERVFRQSVLESMPLLGPDQHGLLLNTTGPLAQQQTRVLIPWDDPLSYAKQQLPNQQTKCQTSITEDPGSSQNNNSVCGQLCVDLSDIQSCRLRSLSDWHFTEHHDATVFPQVLQSASEAYRCLDTFPGSHDNILYIICHNPIGPQRQCKEFWDTALHTDVGFRKYLDHVADTISDWTREEETKRKAKELRHLSPSESLKGDRDLDSRAEEVYPEPVIRNDSLKAWKLEQDRLKEEETAKKLKKDNPGGGKWPREKSSRAASARGRVKDKNKALSGGKMSRGEMRGGVNTTTAPPLEDDTEPQPAEEPGEGFLGYNMGGKLVQVSGRLHHLFPSDGGHITVENVSYVEGSSLMKVGVRKDGHHFYTHINHVLVEPEETPQDEETKDQTKHVKKSKQRKKPKPRPTSTERTVSKPVEIVRQGSFSAVLHNKVHLSYSYYGPTGQDTVSSRADQASFLQTPDSQTRPQQSQSEVCEGRPASPSCPFNSLNLSVPSGLLLQFLIEDTPGVSSEERSVLVRQTFPLHGGEGAGGLRDPFLSRERSRIITNHGAVVRYMRDGSTEVLFADGSVSFSQDSGPVWVPDSEVEEENTELQDNKKGKRPKNDAEPAPQRGCWVTTTPSGARISTVGNTHKHVPTSPVLAFHATDPSTQDVMLSREDRVVSVHNPGGSLTVEHSDGTRITSLYQDRLPHTLLYTRLQPESACDSREETGRDSVGNACGQDGTRQDRTKPSGGENGEEIVCENNNVCTKERVVLVEKEGCATVVMYPDRRNAHVFLADGTVIAASSHGAYQVLPSSLGLLQIQSDGRCVYWSNPPVTISPEGGSPSSQLGNYVMSHTDKVACDTTDHDGNHFQVMEDGQISAVISSPVESTLEEGEEEEDGEVARLHVKQREHFPRLFVVHEDGSAIELLSSQTVEQLLSQADSDPTVALLKEPLPDTQGEFGITILKPCHQSVWSQWLLRKQNPNIIPANLRNRSWHNFPRVERRTPGPPFGSELGRGLTQGERSGGSSAQRQPIQSCPEALELRELRQHRPITMQLRNTLDTRLKEYMESLLKREQLSEEIKDPRTEEERVHASDLLKLVLSLLHHQTPDMRSLFLDLPPVPKADDAQVFLKDAPQEKSNSPRGSSGHYKSVQLDVTGNPRRTKVNLPTSILSSKPFSVPNEQFLSVEEPVRRKCRTISLNDPNCVVRGFQLLPSSVDFGMLREGTSYAVTVFMKNVGVDTCRFSVQQPPPATGLRVFYNPGPVAAGLQVELKVELFAMSVVQEGALEPKNSISQHITINTEMDILYLPVTANILSGIPTCGGWGDRRACCSAGEVPTPAPAPAPAPAVGRYRGRSHLDSVLRKGGRKERDKEREKMQTEEETATAEEPILEEGAGREQ